MKTYKKIFIAFLLAFAGSGSVVLAQSPVFTKPDYAVIKEFTHNKNSINYYPTIYKRYLNNDTTLSLSQYRMLYFGSFFQPSMAPLLEGDRNAALKALMKKDEIVAEDIKQMVTLLEQDLKKDPMDLENLMNAIFIYHYNNDTATYDKYIAKATMLIKTILSSGDGKTDSTAWHVRKESDELALVRSLGYKTNGAQQRTASLCDVVLVMEGEEKLNGLYFDVKQMLAARPKAKATLPMSSKKKKSKAKK